MTPVFSEIPPRARVDIRTIIDNPLAVWYEHLGDAVDGNSATSTVYNTEMGVTCAEENCRLCVQNQEYWESYDRFKMRKLLDEVWIHKLVWRVPTTGEIKHKISIAFWASPDEIIGEVRPDVSVRPVKGFVLLKHVIIFTLGFVLGFLLRGLV